jgi:hypothetical protein
VSGRARDDKLPHDVAASRRCPYIIVARSTAHDPPMTTLIAFSSGFCRYDRMVLTHRNPILKSPTTSRDEFGQVGPAVAAVELTLGRLESYGTQVFAMTIDTVG